MLFFVIYLYIDHFARREEAWVYCNWAVVYMWESLKGAGTLVYGIYIPTMVCYTPLYKLYTCVYTTISQSVHNLLGYKIRIIFCLLSNQHNKWHNQRWFNIGLLSNNNYPVVENVLIS